MGNVNTNTSPRAMRYENTNPEMAVFTTKPMGNKNTSPGMAAATTKPMGNKNTSPIVEVPRTMDCPPDKLPTLAYNSVSKKMCENSY